ncbi:YjjG family noncanonical pyrimidine nucleotidase [Abyssalbus ytuae]|uniref:YjjG family noncanonical pyrimidine nucleotidase n=1 Tax=Abyssalbus ytuae TaxID=2926907 RepID=UPI0034E2CB80
MKSFITDVFFDLDHTLWDFEKNSALTFRKIFLDNSINIELAGFLEVYIPKNLEYWKLYREEKITKEKLRFFRLKDTFDILGCVVNDETIYKLADEYIENLPQNNFLLNGTLEILNYLKPNYHLHIITNGFEEVQKSKLNNSQIDHYFTHVINSEMAGVKKPNPVIFELALNKACVPAQQTVMIGDSFEEDIIGAKNMGMNAIHFNTKNEAPHNQSIVINSLLEIKHYL